jgi:hypothetical protein
MKTIEITTTTNLGDLERLLVDATSNPTAELTVYLARQRKNQFFKDPALAQFFATLARVSSYTLVDWHDDWKADAFAEYYAENLAGLSGATFASKIVNVAGKAPPLGIDDVSQSIVRRNGLLKPYGETKPRVRELAFLAFDPKVREPAALTGLIYDQDGFVRRLQKWREELLDIRPDYQQGLFSSPGAPRPIMEFLHELYQNGAEHGNKTGDNDLISGIRSLSMRRHSPGSMQDLIGFAQGFPELEQYVDQWSRLNRGTTFIEVSVNDVGLGIVDRFVATRPEFLSRALEADPRLQLLLRILLTPRSQNGAGTYEQAYSSKDITGQERGAGRGLERALDAVKKLNGFVSLRTGEFWLYRSFATGDGFGDGAMLQVAGGPFAPVVGTCFTALFPINLQA